MGGDVAVKQSLRGILGDMSGAPQGLAGRGAEGGGGSGGSGGGGGKSGKSGGGDCRTSGGRDGGEERDGDLEVVNILGEGGGPGKGGFWGEAVG